MPTPVLADRYPHREAVRRMLDNDWRAINFALLPRGLQRRHPEEAAAASIVRCPRCTNYGLIGIPFHKPSTNAVMWLRHCILCDVTFEP